MSMRVMDSHSLSGASNSNIHSAAKALRSPRTVFSSDISAARAACPPGGAKITIRDGKLSVPDNPIIPFIEGDGTGPTSGAPRCACSMRPCRRPTAASARSTGWRSTPARSRTSSSTPGCRTRRQACRDYLVSIKGPLTTPIGGGIRSLNVALRQMLDLYVCLRPVRWFKGVPSPVKNARQGRHGDLPREHRGHLRRHRVRGRAARRTEVPPVQGNFPKEFRRSASRTPRGIGIKPVSQEGTERLVRARRSSTPSSTSARA
jgi:isocitrate dehydrogenase